MMQPDERREVLAQLGLPEWLSRQEVAVAALVMELLSFDRSAAQRDKVLLWGRVALGARLTPQALREAVDLVVGPQPAAQDASPQEEPDDAQQEAAP